VTRNRPLAFSAAVIGVVLQLLPTWGLCLIFRERGVEIVVVEVDSGIDSICTNIEEAGVVLATRTTKGVKFPKSVRHKERGIVAHEDGVVVITFHLDLHVW